MQGVAASGVAVSAMPYRFMLLPEPDGSLLSTPTARPPCGALKQEAWPAKTTSLFALGLKLTSFARLRSIDKVPHILPVY
jgi:hypothetical protein